MNAVLLSSNGLYLTHDKYPDIIPEQLFWDWMEVQYVICIVKEVRPAGSFVSQEYEANFHFATTMS